MFMKMLNIGLMMTYNEADIIQEVMDANERYFDIIYVLDGSDDGTDDILRKYKNVKYILKDQQLFPKRKVSDGARQFLLEKAQEEYGCNEGWFTLLHGDEIFVDDPNIIAERADKKKSEIINWHVLNFFWSINQKDQGIDPKKPLTEQMKYYHPGGLEVRQFKNKPNIFYNLNQIYRVLPYGLKLKPYLDYPILKHYPVRSYIQKEKKPITGVQARRDNPAVQHEKHQGDIFVESLDSAFKQVRCYEGSFEEFEPGHRPAFFWQWLSWHKYKPVDPGFLKILLHKKKK